MCEHTWRCTFKCNWSVLGSIFKSYLGVYVKHTGSVQSSTIRSLPDSILKCMQTCVSGSFVDCSMMYSIKHINHMCIIAVWSTCRSTELHSATHQICDVVPFQNQLLCELGFTHDHFSQYSFIN